MALVVGGDANFSVCARTSADAVPANSITGKAIPSASFIIVLNMLSSHWWPGSPTAG
jgi:hypothetical protein